jgi:4-hydroxybenzoate polyprenyltransferase
MFLALSKLRINFTKNTIKTRNFQRILFFYFFFSCIGFFLMPAFTLDRLTLLTVPASIFLAYYYISAKRRLWLFELSLWVLIALILHNHLF